MATPLAVVKERFESKEKLVAALEKLATKELWIGRVNDVKGLKRASNKKLIRLHTSSKTRRSASETATS
jgi:hypothetical protein